MVRRIIPFTLAIILVFLPTSCSNNQYKADISSVSLNLGISRLEKDLFGADPNSISGILPELKKNYGSFLQSFSYVINAGDVNDPSFGDFLTRFCTDRLNVEVYGEVSRIYPDVEWIRRDLEEAFRHWLFYFPGRVVPSVYTCTTGFNYSIIPGDSLLGIGLDSYLGSDCDYYKRLEIYNYIAARMNPANLVPDAIHGWGQYHWGFSSVGYEKDNALARLLHEAKLKYFEKCMLPDISDELLHGFTSRQMEFCFNNEQQMWTYLVENDLLFSSDQFTIRKLTGEAPFTGYFTNESPGRAAVWIGFRIIERYMQKNPATTLAELMVEKDIQKILEKSEYDPS